MTVSLQTRNPITSYKWKVFQITHCRKSKPVELGRTITTAANSAMLKARGKSHTQSAIGFRVPFASQWSKN